MPFFSVLAYMVVSRITHAVGLWLIQTGRIDETTAFYALDMAGARTMLETIMTLNMSFLVFTFGSLLVAIQVAGGQYTPRIIATTLLRDNAIRFTVGYFVFTLLFAVRALIGCDGDTVHQFNTFIASVLGLDLDRGFPLSDRPRGADVASDQHRAARGKNGIAVIESMYPNPTRRASPRIDRRTRVPAAKRCPLTIRAAGSILQRWGKWAAAVRTIFKPEYAPYRRAIAQARNPQSASSPTRVPRDRARGESGGTCRCGTARQRHHRIRPAGGRLRGGGRSPVPACMAAPSAIDDKTLRGAVAFGSERTIEQDPTFAFRILVDIAIKALSRRSTIRRRP